VRITAKANPNEDDDTVKSATDNERQRTTVRILSRFPVMESFVPSNPLSSQLHVGHQIRDHVDEKQIIRALLLYCKSAHADATVSRAVQDPARTATAHGAPSRDTRDPSDAGDGRAVYASSFGYAYARCGDSDTTGNGQEWVRNCASTAALERLVHVETFEPEGRSAIDATDDLISTARRLCSSERPGDAGGHSRAVSDSIALPGS